MAKNEEYPHGSQQLRGVLLDLRASQKPALMRKNDDGASLEKTDDSRSG